MENHRISSITGTFNDPSREIEFLRSAWLLYAASLRVPLFLLGTFIVLGGYLDFVWYGLSTHFFSFMLIRIAIASALSFIAFQTYSAQKNNYFDKEIGVAQLLILFLWFAIFYDRTFFNTGGITSESFFTVLFVTYPLLVFYVIRGKILYSLFNSILALATYLTCLALHPSVEIQFRVTEILVFIFFIYYSFVLQRQLNTEERKRYNGEEQQVKALHLAQEESEEKTRFIAATSHDLRQPLHALSLYIDILDEGASGSESTKDSIKHAKSSVASLNDLLIALLDISKLDAGAVEPNRTNLHLEKLVEKLFQTYSSIASEKGLTLRLHKRPLIVCTDPVLLERALGNLISNAIQHSNSGAVLIACRERGGLANVEIWDQGPGISEVDLGSIFKEYHKLANSSLNGRQGLGLGLAIVKRISSILDLRLSVKSKLGIGSKFSVSLPLALGKNVVKPIQSENAKPFNLNGLKILVIDDDIEVRHAMQVLLQSWGCVVIVAKSQRGLMEQLSLSEPPDVIISDLNLPEGTDGEKLIQKVRKFFGHEIPALLITGNTEAEFDEAANNSEILLLYKPLGAPQLRIAISRLVDPKIN